MRDEDGEYRWQARCSGGGRVETLANLAGGDWNRRVRKKIIFFPFKFVDFEQKNNN
jgi:hypothetical protein